MTHKPYPAVTSNPDFPKLEEEILASWKKGEVFKQSVEKNPSNSEWVFYDGPPFANGLPHYGHLLTSCVKDLFARYHTMKGEKVERRFGWDCHGLPAEMEAERELGVSGRAAIEKFGVANFNDHCRTSVMKYTHIWQDYVTRAARWVDFENDYKTMDTSYMESVLWAFKQLHDKGLVYESYRVMPYSWAAETPLSNFETRMDDSYREREDKAITVAFKLKEKPALLANTKEEVYVLAWTTTPWTLPSNLALAVSTKLGYTANFSKERNRWEISNTLNTLGVAEDEDKYEHATVLLEGKDLLGLSYEPLFPYFKDTKNAFHVLDGSDFIEEGSGTGVVHLAPGFGEDDQRVCEKNGIPVICPVDEAGKYTNEIFDIDGFSLKGLNVIADIRKNAEEKYTESQLQKYGLANLRIIDYLKTTGAFIKQEEYKHSYPHCWRTNTPLIYKALPSWYVEVTKFRDRMVELNQGINWIPDHIKDGQFGKWLEGARDWSISRNRFWGTPIPVWRTESGKIKVFGSIKELEEFFGVPVKDLHKPFIDSLTKTENGETWKRVSDVFDCWFESGSMPFAQVHYPFENKASFEAHFPADFIVEYVGQTRGWFYTLVVLSTALFDCIPFKNCICHGIILDAEGKKLSKKLRNYPDPYDMFNKYGADAMRWRMISEPVMTGGNLLISKDGDDVREVVRLAIKPIWNAYHFFTLYANTDEVKAREVRASDQLMDRYILSKLKHAVEGIAKALDAFDTPAACAQVNGFFEVLNNWYIRRSRDRFWQEEKNTSKLAAYNTLYTCLVTMAKAAAPLMPLVLESIYMGLSGAEESVHLQSFPDVSQILDEAQLVKDMDKVREICTAALAVRNQENIKVRQPLSSATVYGSNLAGLEDFAELIADELNIKQVKFSDALDKVATLKLQVNLPLVGKRLGAGLGKIMPAVKKGEYKTISTGKIEIAGEVLEGEEYRLLLEPKEKKGAEPLSTQDALVVLDLTITPELKAEGVARDIVRMIQQARKDADLNVSDRISLSVEAPEEVRQAITANENYIKEQTLTTTLDFTSPAARKHKSESELEGGKVVIGFEVAA